VLTVTRSSRYEALDLPPFVLSAVEGELQYFLDGKVRTSELLISACHENH
jgi:hypothetical protein